MKKNENGRSMVEMLGVLAIIGVLSISGIYGYTVAMRRYRANEIVQMASTLSVMAHAMNGGEGGCMELSSINSSSNIAGVKVSIVANGNDILPPDVSIGLEDGDPDNALCTALQDILPQTIAVSHQVHKTIFCSCHTSDRLLPQQKN